MRNFGFPRIGEKESQKNFKWKKMNFTTDLPKNDPLCTYLVATGLDSSKKGFFRMHAVSLAEEYSPEYRLSEVLVGLNRHNNKNKVLPIDEESGSRKVILCHIRRGENQTKAT